MRCHVCTEYCPQEELACEIAKGRMWATQELVKYEQIGTVEEFKSLKSKKEHNYDNCHNLTCKNKSRELGYNQGYNKAIDEFLAEIKAHIKMFGSAYIEDIVKLAEQMKADTELELKIKKWRDSAINIVKAGGKEC